ncbi:shikimate dehydrogenase [Chitinophaga sp. CF118]|uniref:shikimate dehydrogenase family protein n=1 Tax=Chitinophaga sp. CF118 TaxID=1884367 RepID=UPI0008EA00F1|nr:shikimate dehydrogenase [Chitinophaga sp. CF118]SFE95563.1 shikimate dehydrogenase [Chitinophaga sp. CF118]
MKVYGLIGYPLSHSFSKDFFAEKFARENIKDCIYESFPLPAIKELKPLLASQPELLGLNVTIPYKEAVIPYLDELSPAAAQIKAVNCIRIIDGVKTGFNTDAIGFRRSLEPLLQSHHTNALILGTGGAAKAVQYVLEALNIPYKLVSRKAAHDGAVTYDQLDAEVMEEHTIIINTTPLGMYPNAEAAPELPYNFLSSQHLLYDLIYNPAMTAFLKHGADKGATIKNGHEMLILQAEASWEIWNDL